MRLGVFQRGLKPLLDVVDRTVQFLLLDLSLGEELLRVDGPHRGMLEDLSRHHRLGDAGVVSFVMPATAIADQVDDHV